MPILKEYPIEKFNSSCRARIMYALMLPDESYAEDSLENFAKTFDFFKKQGDLWYNEEYQAEISIPSDLRAVLITFHNPHIVHKEARARFVTRIFVKYSNLKSMGEGIITACSINVYRIVGCPDENKEMVKRNILQYFFNKDYATEKPIDVSFCSMEGSSHIQLFPQGGTTMLINQDVFAATDFKLSKQEVIEEKLLKLDCFMYQVWRNVIKDNVVEFMKSKND